VCIRNSRIDKAYLVEQRQKNHCVIIDVWLHCSPANQ
jgi:hypothetical protein